ncbi:hypothetical protein EO087_11665 [Dyella sp. M7H15-1]|uniref:hypothetical protein n=1 Tax=Dyella sp. M7H15-1 TaxID=2501295 RepID=UPI0010050AAB|nr:hypothetical protein [Dyella sp. M7H15-1]QAU24563.1 hypothetical protein EO087_11665 [Dyella sp. M7H15-1]
MKVVSIRLSEAAATRYQAMADEAWPNPIPLSTYLKRRLEEGDAIAEHLDALRLDIRDLAVDIGRGHGRPDGSHADSVAIETLLLLRAVTNPQHVRMVQAELQRQGITPWQAETSQ